jgi:hypothetical protein
MASRNGIGINNLPFEQRCPPPKPRKPELLTRQDRFVLALCGSFLGLFLWTAGYVILCSMAMKAGARIAARPQAALAAPIIDPMDRLPPYWWGAYPAFAFACYGSIVGAERMMDSFQTIMRWLSKFAEAASRQQ